MARLRGIVENLLRRVDGFHACCLDVEPFAGFRYGLVHLIVLVEHEKSADRWIRWDELGKFAIVQFLLENWR